MKLGKWIKVIDPVIEVEIWSQYTEDEPLYKGNMFNIPWTLVDKEIGRVDDNINEPIFIVQRENEYGVTLPCIIINIIE